MNGKVQVKTNEFAVLCTLFKYYGVDETWTEREFKHMMERLRFKQILLAQLFFTRDSTMKSPLRHCTLTFTMDKPVESISRAEECMGLGKTISKLKLDFETPPYTCCDVVLHTKQEYIKHSYGHFNCFHCVGCGKEIATKDAYERHLLRHITEVSCEECGKTFKNNSNLKRHQRIHTGDKRFVCDFCGFRTIQSNQVKAHMRLKHKMETVGRVVETRKKQKITDNDLEGLLEQQKQLSALYTTDDILINLLEQQQDRVAMLQSKYKIV